MRTAADAAWLSPIAALVCAVAAGSVQSATPVGGPADADLIIRGATVFDGSPNDAVLGDVVVRGDRIVSVGPNSGARFRARRTLDGTGLIAAPGFIDPHTHPDGLGAAKGDKARSVAPWLMQGVTSVFVGVDRAGPPGHANDIAGFFHDIARRPTAVNVATYVGFGAVRGRVLGDNSRAPSAAELARMRALVARGMCDGALGLSTGLFYSPQSFATTDEVVALARAAAEHGGIYDSHLRDESSYTIGLLAAVEEAIRIGRDAGLPVHIAHIKALGVDVQGKSAEVIALIEAARQRGQNVTADQYPWNASGTSLEAALIPRWAFEGGRGQMLSRLNDPALNPQLQSEMADNLRRRGGAGALMPVAPGRPWSAQPLSEIAARWGVAPLDAAVRIIREQPDDTAAISFNMADDDIERFMRQPWVVTSSDGSSGHPRMYATFPRKYSIYVNEKHVLTLSEFVSASSGRTADQFGLDHRGHLRPGDFADVVVFDPLRYRPRADYEHPAIAAEGVVWVLVNGQIAVERGELTGVTAGRALQRTTASRCAAS
ncbi:MAG TPA: amidohydrolase family protein [Vicinamibacterales bacterium]|nr:amidohydrolase family protein [Vicinamibacterales bacterium]